GPAHALRTHHDFFPEAEIEAPAFAPVVRESGAQQRGAEAWRRADANRLAVQARALSALGNEAFFFQRVEDYAELHAAAPFVRDRYAELRIAVREVGGAVERIDNPSMVAASDSRSASVTRSIEFDLRLMVILLSRLRWIRPAARAARSATCSISLITIQARYYSRGESSSAKRRSIDNARRDFASTSAASRPGLRRARPCRATRARGRWTADDSGRRERRGNSAPWEIFSASRARRRPPCSSQPRVSRCWSRRTSASRLAPIPSRPGMNRGRECSRGRRRDRARATARSALRPRRWRTERRVNI